MLSPHIKRDADKVVANIENTYPTIVEAYELFRKHEKKKAVLT
jgi:hypothetical protein